MKIFIGAFGRYLDRNPRMFWIVGETRVPGGNPRKDEVNIQTPHIETRTFLLWGNNANHLAIQDTFMNASTSAEKTEQQPPN